VRPDKVLRIVNYRAADLRRSVLLKPSGSWRQMCVFVEVTKVEFTGGARELALVFTFVTACNFSVEHPKELQRTGLADATLR
jgi:hypothetical protein